MADFADNFGRKFERMTAAEIEKQAKYRYHTT